MAPTNILYNVLILGFSIGLTYNREEAADWYFSSQANPRDKEFRIIAL